MSDHDELRSLLARIRRRWFAQTVLATSGRAAAAAAVPILAAATTWWGLRPTGTILVVLTAVAIALSALAALRIFLRMPPRPDDCQVARFIEEQTSADGVAPALCGPDALVSAVEVMETPDRHAGGFVGLVVSNALTVLRGIDPAAVIPPAAVRRAVLRAGGGAVVLAGSLMIAFPLLRGAGATTWIALFPQSVQIAVLTGDARVAAGQPLRIMATVHGRGAAWLSVVPSLVVSADGQERTVPMSRDSGSFAYAFESVDRSFQYKVTAGKASSTSYSVTALFPPRITRIDLRYDYPTFSGLKPRTDTDDGDIYGPAGTRVGLLIYTDKAIAKGELALDGGRALALRPAGEALVATELILAKDDAYRLKLTDKDGLHSPGEVEYFIRIMDDRPPDVRMVRPSADQGITPLEEVPIEARADDDYGVAQFDLVYAVAGRPPHVVPFKHVAGTEVAKVGAHLLAAEELRVQPGDVITYYARARDVGRGKRPTETRSDIFFLEVKPFTEEFVSAQSQAMGGGAAGNQIDGLIAAQKEIINATWNLERRSGAGRSAEDLKAVGRAQAELKTRVEQMMMGGRRGGRFFVPQQIGPPPQPPRRSSGADPLPAAVDAMVRAVEQLQNEKTGEAIPHEMAALQRLLQAQAEVRRRQVMQQSASGAGQGGSNRSDRDLSALFDRELQRQQRTNYETPKQATDGSERQDGSDALERVRELARRQEELARRQRELANSQRSAEETKRHLEELTREQQELRRQAEALEKQMRGSQGGSATGKKDQGSTAGAQAAQEMREALEQMRNAANEMQRRNPGAAAGIGEKAAESLRQMERQMGGATTNARQRAAGELQLEAQQIAELQRRIASEVSRLEKDDRNARGASGTRGAKPTEGDGPNGDALRRLAAEKDKLADRVDELQRGARQLQRDTPGEAGAPFREAAQQLQGQQIGSRMRASGREMRNRAGSRGAGREGQGRASQPQSQAQVEQQISRALDSIVDTLGGSAQADGRRLTGELDRTREMRERLNRLEQQVRDAEERANGRQEQSGAPSSPGRGQQAGSRGQSGRTAGGGDGGAADQQLQRAREDYARELQRSRESLGRLQGPPRGGETGGTPEQHEFSQSSPGNEAFKQDFGRWAALRKDVDLAMERYEAAVAARLARKMADDRLSAGGSERVPEAYRPLVSRYFESIAKVKK